MKTEEVHLLDVIGRKAYYTLHGTEPKVYELELVRTLLPPGTRDIQGVRLPYLRDIIAQHHLQLGKEVAVVPGGYTPVELVAYQFDIRTTHIGKKPNL